MRRVLIVDDEENLRHLLQILLQREGYEAISVPSVDAALAEMARQPFDIVMTDLRMPGRNGMELVDEIRARRLGTTCIVMTAYGSRDVAVEAMKRGAYDYLSKPFETDEVVLLLRKAEERERLFRDNQSLRKQIRLVPDGTQSEGGLVDLVANSPRMNEIFRTVRKISEFKTTVLVTGESGTGKELIARAIHRLSPRKDAPFVAVNCGAIPGPLLESELFGHRKGAFTDASRDRKGLFEEATGGTLFLDEIGEMPVGLQVKLLRVLQEEEIRRLGDVEDVRVDVRVVAATARDLAAEVRGGGFREDLFYRLNVMHLVLPPLRERREDIPALVAHFVAVMNVRMGLTISGVTPEAMARLVEWPWPGNVRELENTIERAMVLCEGQVIDAANLPERTDNADGAEGAELPSIPQGAAASDNEDLSIKRASRRSEEELIRRALARTGGNRTRAAELLEISHRALLYKIKEFGISPLRGEAQTPPPVSLPTFSPSGDLGGRKVS